MTQVPWALLSMLPYEFGIILCLQIPTSAWYHTSELNSCAGKNQKAIMLLHFSAWISCIGICRYGFLSHEAFTTSLQTSESSQCSASLCSKFLPFSNNTVSIFSFSSLVLLHWSTVVNTSSATNHVYWNSFMLSFRVMPSDEFKEGPLQSMIMRKKFFLGS